MTYKRAFKISGILIMAMLLAYEICVFISFVKTEKLEIQSLEISVNVKRAPTQMQAQKYVDTEDMAAYYGKYISDHKEQAFARLPEMKLGDSATFKGHEYTCTAITKGYSIKGLQPLSEGETIPPADIYLLTCTGEEEHQVWVICLTKTK